MKFSRLSSATVGLTFVIGFNFAWAVSPPVTSEQRGIAERVAQAGVPLAELSEKAPDSYTVKRGDTLWEISSLFLKRPWRWPELWGMNKDQIRNPHLIYPGQLLVLVKSSGRALLQMGEGIGSKEGVSNDSVKYSPRVRIEAGTAGAVASISHSAIEPFLSRPLIIEEQGLQNAARVVAAQEGRVYTSKNDLIYVRGVDPASEARLYDVFRPGRPLLDPDTRAVVAYEANFLGTAERIRPGDPATFRISTSKEEIGVGERLLPSAKAEPVTYMPHEANTDIEGRVLAIYGNGVNQAASHMVIALNRGTDQGVEQGHVLRLFRYGKTITDHTAVNRREQVRLPDEAYGYVFVFRLFKNVSYGLVLGTNAPVIVGDRFSAKLD